MIRVVAFLFCTAVIAAAGGCVEQSKAEGQPPRAEFHERRFDALLAQRPELTYDELVSDTPKRAYLAKPSIRRKRSSTTRR
jgi:hypothetical protein